MFSVYFDPKRQKNSTDFIKTGWEIDIQRRALATMPQFERWSAKERERLAEFKRLLGSKLTTRPQYPDVVGDRRLVRFLRGVDDIQVALAKYSKFLEWRDANGVDEIRNDILYRGMNDPHKFPRGEVILRMFPQLVCAADACDNDGNPVSVEEYSFSPSEALKAVPREQYLIFQIYTMEYKVLVMEQLSNSKERAKLAHLQREYSSHGEEWEGEGESPSYGVVLRSFYFRNFEGFGLDHLGGDGQQLLGAVLEVATANYPELLHKSQMINVPWAFNIIWVFVKPFLDKATVDKVTIHAWGADYINALRDEISIESIPKSLGGKYEGGNSPFHFDLSPSGPFGPPPDSIVAACLNDATLSLSQTIESENLMDPADTGATAVESAETNNIAVRAASVPLFHLTEFGSEVESIDTSTRIADADVVATKPIPTQSSAAHGPALEEAYIASDAPPPASSDRVHDDETAKQILNDDHLLKHNPYAWLLYLRIVVVFPIASSGSRLLKRLFLPSATPLVNSLAFASLTLSGCAIIHHWVVKLTRK